MKNMTGQNYIAQTDTPQLRVTSISQPGEIMTRQKLPYFTGISENTVGSKEISMNLVVIPPGACADPHYHTDYESAIYLLEGEVETRYGENLENSIINKAGDFIFIPPRLYHQPFNMSSSSQAIAIVARNDPREEENIAHDVTELSAAS